MTILSSSSLPHITEKLFEISFILLRGPAKLLPTVSKLIKSTKELFSRDTRKLCVAHEDSSFPLLAKVLFIIPTFHPKPFDRYRSGVHVLVSRVALDVEEDVVLVAVLFVFTASRLLNELPAAIETLASLVHIY